jgi:hypothetical protein
MFLLGGGSSSFISFIAGMSAMNPIIKVATEPILESML